MRRTRAGVSNASLLVPPKPGRATEAFEAAPPPKRARPTATWTMKRAHRRSAYRLDAALGSG